MVYSVSLSYTSRLAALPALSNEARRRFLMILLTQEFNMDIALALAAIFWMLWQSRPWPMCPGTFRWESSVSWIMRFLPQMPWTNHPLDVTSPFSPMICLKEESSLTYLSLNLNHRLMDDNLRWSPRIAAPFWRIFGPLLWPYVPALSAHLFYCHDSYIFEVVFIVIMIKYGGRISDTRGIAFKGCFIQRMLCPRDRNRRYM